MYFLACRGSFNWRMSFTHAQLNREKDVVGDNYHIGELIELLSYFVTVFDLILFAHTNPYYLCFNKPGYIILNSNIFGLSSYWVFTK